MEILGIDIGGTGMKGAIVNTVTGELISERFRIPTPTSRKPDEMAEVFNKIIAHFNYKGPVGCGFPTIIKHGVCKAYGNLHKSWKNLNAEELFTNTSGLPVTVINDADAAGYAVMNYGKGKNKEGLVLIITIGTGIGSGAFFDGKLLQNFELGQFPHEKYDKIERWISKATRKQENLSYKTWGKRINKYLELVELIVCPDYIILGGGGSSSFDKFKEFIKIDTPVVSATLGNNAGIIGAAAAALH